MKILYQYARCKDLLPTKGDLINELNFIKALSTFAEVTFAQNSYNFDPKEFDIAFIRANKTMFDYCKGIKRIWMAAPYDKEMFEQTDYIATFSTAWTNVLKNGVKHPTANPDGIVWKNAITVHQVISNHFFKAPQPVKRYNGFPIIGVFGRIANTTYPHLLINSINDLNMRYPEFDIIIGTSKNKSSYDIPTRFMKKIPYHDMPDAISACDIIVINQHGYEWDIGGSGKTIETAARGVPIILAESKARKENLGNKYPYFLPNEIFEQPITRHKISVFTYLVHKILTSKFDISSYLIDRAKKYSIYNQGNKLKSLFSTL